MKFQSAFIRAAFALALLAAGTAAGDTIYKWVDEKGVVQYSETPPSRAAGKDVRVQRIFPTDQELAREKLDRDRALREDEVRKAQRESQQATLRDGTLAPVPGESDASLDEQRDVLRAMIPLDALVDADCSRHKVLDTKKLEARAAAKVTVERWTLDRCGKRVAYRVTFTAVTDERTRWTIAEDQ